MKFKKLLLSTLLAFSITPAALAELTQQEVEQLQLVRDAFDKEDYHTMVKIASKLAEKGDGTAQFILGVAYENGLGVKQDLKKAFEWLKKSAEQGNGAAQSNVSEMYLKGQGVERDASQAFHWAQKSALQGDKKGQFIMGIFYDEGVIVKQDKAKAKEYYGLGCDSGEQAACEGYRDLNEKGY